MESRKTTVDYNYKQLVEKVLNEGYLYDDPNREGVQRLEIPSCEFRHDFKHGFPAITLKKLAFKSVVTELIWFLRGDTNIKYLVDNGCNIWNKDAYNYYLKQAKGQPEGMILTFNEWLNEIKDGEDLLGDLGKVYGHYWRNFSGVDQIKELIQNMIHKPMSSELLVVARDPSDKNEQALPCCHYGFQIVMRPLILRVKDSITNREYSEIEVEEYRIKKNIPKYGFELHWKQRSCDLFLGKIWELLK